MVLLYASGRGYSNDIMVQVLFNQLVGLANGLVQGVADVLRLGRADLKPQPLLPLLQVISYYQLDISPALGQLPQPMQHPPHWMGLVTRHRT